MSQVLKPMFGIVLYLLESALNLNTFFQYVVNVRGYATTLQGPPDPNHFGELW